MAAIVVMSVLSAVPLLYQLRQHARVVSLREQKEQQQAELASVRTELAELAQSLNDLGRRISRADALRTKRPWADLLGLIVDCMPQEVWLTSVGTDPLENAAPASRRTNQATKGDPKQQAPADEIVVMAGPSRLDVTGYAVEHEHLYDFMARLKASGAFDSVELVKAGTEPVLHSRAVRFVLTCTWQ